MTFPQEPRLWKEVTDIVDTLQSESVDEQTLFLQGMKSQVSSLYPSLLPREAHYWLTQPGFAGLYS